MKEKQIVVEKKEKKGEFFEVEQKGELVKRKKKNPPQCFVWFRSKFFPSHLH